MASKLLLEIVTPDRKVLSQEVDYVGARGLRVSLVLWPITYPFFRLSA